jgi:hypothetical protein
LDIELVNFDENKALRKLPGLASFSLNHFFERFWKKKFVSCLQGLDTWDFQWLFTIWSNGGCAVMPTLCLSENVGFDSNATHTKTLPSWLTENRNHFSKNSLYFTNLHTVGNPPFRPELDNLLERRILDFDSRVNIANILTQFFRIWKRKFANIKKLHGLSNQFESFRSRLKS